MKTLCCAQLVQLNSRRHGDHLYSATPSAVGCQAVLRGSEASRWHHYWSSSQYSIWQTPLQDAWTGQAPDSPQEEPCTLCDSPSQLSSLRKDHRSHSPVRLQMPITQQLHICQNSLYPFHLPVRFTVPLSNSSDVSHEIYPVSISKLDKMSSSDHSDWPTAPKFTLTFYIQGSQRISSSPQNSPV